MSHAPHAKPAPTAQRSSLWSLLLDLVYPPCCALCEKPLTAGAALCATCDAEMPRLTAPFCNACGEPFYGLIDDEFACPNCSKIRFAFDFARPAMPHDDRVRQLIHGLKYRRHIHLAAELGRLAISAFDDPRLAPARAERWPLIPVPLHSKRLQRRHFNQAAEIARAVSSTLALPVCHALIRYRNTDTQTQLTRRQRQKNLRHAFRVSPKGIRLLASAPPGVIIIDDVLTTGSTIDACARTLKNAGFRNIIAVTVMRG